MAKLDPRVKLLTLIIFSMLAVLSKDIVNMGIVLVSSLFLTLLLGGQLAVIFKKLKRFVQLLVFISIVQMIFIREGQPLIVINGVTIVYLEGLLRGVMSAMRFFVIIALASIMLSENTGKVVASLQKMKVPPTFCFMIKISLHFLPSFRESFKDSLVAIELRGVNLKKIKLGQRVSLYARLLTPVIGESIKNARELATCMQSRGFGVMKQRTIYADVKLNAKDYVAMAFIVAMGVAIGYIVMFL